MALVICYDPEGQEHQKETVDARECILHCGYTMQKPVDKASGSVAAEVTSATVPVDTSKPWNTQRP